MSQIITSLAGIRLLYLEDVLLGLLLEVFSQQVSALSKSSFLSHHIVNKSQIKSHILLFGAAGQLIVTVETVVTPWLLAAL